MRNIIFPICISLLSLTSYAQTPTWTWVLTAGGTGIESGVPAIDANGNVYVAGRFSSSSISFGTTTLTNVGSDDGFLVKYSSAGIVIWAISFGGGGSEITNGVEIDPSGNIYVAGNYSSSTLTIGPTTLTNTGSNDLFIAKFNPSGIPAWAVSFGGSGLDEFRGLATDGGGNVYITGRFLSPSIVIGSTTLTNNGNSDIFFAKYSSSGAPLWAVSAGGVNQEIGLAISTTATGNVYLTGNFNSPTLSFGPVTLTNSGPSSTSDIFLVNYDASGSVLWAVSAGGISGDSPRDLTTDSSGNILITGIFSSASAVFGTLTLTNNTPGLSDIFIVKYNSSGITQWAVSGNGSAPGSNDFGNVIRTDASGNVFVAGHFDSQTVSFGTTSLVNTGLTAGYVVKYSNSGSLSWAIATTGSGTCRPVGKLVVDLNGSLYLSGAIANQINFGTISLTSAGSDDMFLAKLDPGCTSALPQPGTITGNIAPCSGSSQTYSVSTLAGATSYTWTLPSGWTGTSTTNSINVTVGASSGIISVTANNSCGSSTPQTLVVTSIPVPLQPGTISGNNSVCQGSSQTYSVVSVAGATSYTWTLPSGWSGTSITNSINVTAGATSGNISITANNSCGASTVQTIAVTINTIPLQPGTIAGNNAICQGSSQTYSVAAITGATSFTWTLPSGWTGTSSSNSINVIAGSNSGNISVTANNSCGGSNAQTLSVTISSVPSQPSSITGNNMLCSGSTQTYSVTTVPGATGYTWTLPSGWTGTSTTNSINATAGNTGGTISVTANNSCGTSTAQTLALSINSVPSQPGQITGNVTANVGQTLSYSINDVSGATGYNWTVSSGGTILSGQNTTSVSVNWQTAGNYTLSINATNACGSGISQTLNITVSIVTAIGDPANPFYIRIAPNPSNGDTYLMAKGVINKTIRIEISNVYGQRVFSSMQKAGTNDYSQLLKLDLLAKGIYQMQISIGDKTYLKTFARGN